MANTTFIELTNRLLRRFNEVEVIQTDFNSTSGIHSAAKDCVNDSLREIMAEHYQWSFNAVEETKTLTAGTFEYSWPTDFKSVEWQSFQLQEDDSLGIATTRLRQIERNYHYRNFYDKDRTGELDETYRNVPVYVFQAHGSKFGISPNPDKAYELKYKYYTKFSPLSVYNDETTVPPEFDHVILYGAMKHMNYFLDNNEQARQVDDELFKPALRSMRTLLINDDFLMEDTRKRNVNAR